MNKITLINALQIISKEVTFSGIPVTERTNQILSIVPQTPNSCLYFEVTSSSSVGATLIVDLQPDWDACLHDTVNNHLTVRVQLTWASSHRTIANAQANVALYQKLINLGATLEAAFEGFDIIHPKTVVT